MSPFSSPKNLSPSQQQTPPSQSTSGGSNDSTASAKKRKRAASTAPLSPTDAVLVLSDGRQINVLEPPPFSPLQPGARWSDLHQLILNAALNDEDTIPTPLRAALCTYFGVNAQRVSNWIRLHKNKTKKASQDALPVAALALLPESQASAGGRQEEAAASVVAVARPIVQQGEDDGSETEDEEEAPASDPGPERQRQRRERTHAPAPAVVEPGRRVSTMEALSGKPSHLAGDAAYTYASPSSASSPVAPPSIATSIIAVASTSSAQQHHRVSPSSCLTTSLRGTRISPEPDFEPEPQPATAPAPLDPFATIKADILRLYPLRAPSHSSSSALGLDLLDLDESSSSPDSITPSLITFDPPSPGRPRGRPPPSTTALSSLLARAADASAPLDREHPEASFASGSLKRTAPPGPLVTGRPTKFVKLSGFEPVPRRGADALGAGWLSEVTSGWFGQGWKWGVRREDEGQEHREMPIGPPVSEAEDVEMADATAGNQQPPLFLF